MHGAYIVQHIVVDEDNTAKEYQEIKPSTSSVHQKFSEEVPIRINPVVQKMCKVKGQILPEWILQC